MKGKKALKGREEECLIFFLLFIVVIEFIFLIQLIEMEWLTSSFLGDGLFLRLFIRLRRLMSAFQLVFHCDK